MSGGVLKVKCLPGSTVRIKSIKANTSAEVLNEVPHSLDNQYLNWNPLVLTLSENSAKRKWFSPLDKLSSVPPGRVLEVQYSHQPIKVQFNRKIHRLIFHIDEPLKSIISQMQQKLPQLQDVSCKLVMRDLELDINKSIREQNISTDRIFFLLTPNDNPSSEFVTEGDIEDPKGASLSPNINEGLDEILESVTKPSKKGASLFGKSGKSEEADKSKENALKSSNVNVRNSSKEKHKQRVATLTKDGLLSLKKAGEKKAENVIKLGDYMLKEVSESEEKDTSSGKKESAKETLWSIDLVLKEANVPTTSGDKSKGKPLSASSSGLSTADGKFRLWEIKCESDADKKSWISVLKPFVQQLDQSGPVFGAPLASAAGGGTNIPYIVKTCVEYIRQNALDVVGIFRLSGSQVQIDQLKERFDARENVVLDPKQKLDPHNISGLVKLYFRLLPEPVLTFPLYSKFIASQSAKEWNIKIRLIRSLVESLPSLNRSLLVYLISFLVEVNERNEINKMGIPNLATVFAPNLLRSEDGDMGTMVHHTPQINAIVGTLIQDYEYIFNNKDLGEEIAVAQFEYNPEGDGQLKLVVGDQVKVIAQGENGWWQGELKGKIGTFPGSYVKMEKTSRKAKFLEEMNAEKKKLSEKTLFVETMQESKRKMEEELNDLKSQRTEIEAKNSLTKSDILSKMGESNLSVLEKIASLLEKADSCQRELERQNFINELKHEFESLKATLHNPADARKTVKVKDAQKLEGALDDTELKLKEETRLRGESTTKMKYFQSDLRWLASLKQ
eukprot:TRINITY_DN1193_c0_g1_i1.p1 TRINITY_DN1193_c0_g1~~TRINITY_DN1193_c0_g1_i1.p1  ORF type:complete len:786 (-),score=298.11 TRINITY_DN1193_c0_g1_i1:167-2524(-)